MRKTILRLVTVLLAIVTTANAQEYHGEMERIYPEHMRGRKLRKRPPQGKIRRSRSRHLFLISSSSDRSFLKERRGVLWQKTLRRVSFSAW